MRSGPDPIHQKYLELARDPEYRRPRFSRASRRRLAREIIRAERAAVPFKRKGK
jgi:hypothetical protein